MNRLVKLVVALVLATSGFLVAGGTSGAQAATEHRSVTVKSAPAPQRAAKTARTIQLVFTRATRRSFHVKAGISPNFRNRVAVLQFKRKRGGTFHKLRTARSNVNGVAKFGTVHKLGFYRVITNEDALYIRSGSNVIRVYRS